MFSTFNLSKLYNFKTDDEQNLDKSIKLLSFNASFFRVPIIFTEPYFNPKRPTINELLVHWITDQNSDFLLIQEFFNDEKSPYFNNIDYLMNHGGFVDYHYLYRSIHDNGTSRGVIIFSKYPILNKETLFLSDNGYNGAIYSDVLVNRDTLRIVNLHLESSAFRFSRAKSDLSVFKNESLKFIRSGALRSEQIHNVLDQIKDCTHPIILAGDFNSIRYSYIYNEVKKYYQNTFEAVGNGFGFTNSGKLKIPVKIDHQFYNKRIEPLTIEAVDSVNQSDHLPIIASYHLK